jgi:hypothetical protein
MRALDTNLKADLLKQNRTGSESAPPSRPLTRPGTGHGNKRDIGDFASGDGERKVESPPKKARPRSLTFTIHKSKDSAPKRAKDARATSHGRTKSAESTPITSSLASSPGPTAQGFSLLGSNKQATPEDFISYLRKVRKPELVEVGRLQKLRQLLRNETVAWVDSFITQGGMTELVDLLYRIIGIEWR